MGQNIGRLDKFIYRERKFELKVSIVTVYDSINCGSYWQAYALGKVIGDFGCDVVYNKRKKSGGASSSSAEQFKKFFSLCAKRGISAGMMYTKSLKTFKKSQKKLPISDSVNDIDCFVLGSDTIWNLDSNYFRLHSGTYWGIDFFPKKVISYAASAANTKADKVTEELHDAVGKMYAVSVRDSHTYSLIEHDNSKGISFVCDPTLLLQKEDYLQLAPVPVKKGFVFLYVFKELSKEQMTALKEFCKERNLRIVKGTSFYRPSYCDEVVMAEPVTFLSHMLEADYIITDTFHGAVFSVNFNKRFISLDRGKNKVREFLSGVGLENRLIGEDGNISDTLAKDIDYSSANRKIKMLRDESLYFLKSNIVGGYDESIK